MVIWDINDSKYFYFAPRIEILRHEKSIMNNVDKYSGERRDLVMMVESVITS